MKITIPDTKKGVQLAKCFIGSQLVGFDEDRILVGVDARYQYPFYVSDLCQYDKITIDTDKAQMDLRMAIGTDIEFEVYSDGGEEDYFQCKSKLEAIEYCGEIKIDGEWVIPDEIQLSKDYLKRIGVDVKE